MGHFFRGWEFLKVTAPCGLKFHGFLWSELELGILVEVFGPSPKSGSSQPFPAHVQVLVQQSP